MMATVQHFNSKHINPVLWPILKHKNLPLRSQQLALTVSCSNFRTQFESSNKHSVPQHQKNTKKSPRRLITISTSNGRWQSQWTCDYILSLRELNLADLANEAEKNAEVLVSLTIQKHTSFGFSVDGRIVTSFKRNCSCCSKSYHKEIDATFDVWVLPSSKDSDLLLPEVGASDQVIYVKPGSDVDLDSVVQDTIRLIASTKDTCSELCDKSAMTWKYTDHQSSYDQRWLQLLEIKKSMQY